MNFSVQIDRFSNQAQRHHVSLGEPAPEKNAGHWAYGHGGLGRWIAAWTRLAWMAERLIRRRQERDRDRLALADIDASDLSEFGRRVRAHVLRERRDRELRNRIETAPLGARPFVGRPACRGYAGFLESWGIPS
jgi:hypothetical protein